MDSRELPTEVVFLMEAIRSAPSADNSQPWCFEWEDGIMTCRVYSRGGLPSDYHATRIALGAAAENLIQAMQLLGLDISTWYLGEPKEDGTFAQGPVVGPANVIVSSNMLPWIQRHTNRLPYYLEIDSAIVPQINAYQVNKVGVRVITDSKIRQVADWIKLASEIRFQTREVNEWFAASLRYGNSPDEMNDGLHVNTLALPPGGVGLLKLMSNWNRMQWLNRIRAYKLFASIEAANFQKTPLVVAIIGPSCDTAVFDAGRCLQQVWLKVTELGLSAHPYYVVSDLLNRMDLRKIPTQCMAQASVLKDNICSELGSDNTLHCLLRVGMPVGNIATSGRLSLRNLMCNYATKK